MKRLVQNIPSAAGRMAGGPIPARVKHADGAIHKEIHMTYSPGHEKWPEHKVEEKLVRVKDLQDAAWTYEDPYVKRV